MASAVRLEADLVRQHVAGPDRDDAERRLAIDQGGRDVTDGAVAARRHDRVIAAGRRRLARRQPGGVDVLRAHARQRGTGPLQRAHGIVDQRGVGQPGARIGDDEQAAAHGGPGGGPGTDDQARGEQGVALPAPGGTLQSRQVEAGERSVNTGVGTPLVLSVGTQCQQLGTRGFTHGHSRWPIASAGRPIASERHPRHRALMLRRNWRTNLGCLYLALRTLRGAARRWH